MQIYSGVGARLPDAIAIALRDKCHKAFKDSDFEKFSDDIRDHQLVLLMWFGNNDKVPEAYTFVTGDFYYCDKCLSDGEDFYGVKEMEAPRSVNLEEHQEALSQHLKKVAAFAGVDVPELTPAYFVGAFDSIY